MGIQKLLVNVATYAAQTIVACVGIAAASALLVYSDVIVDSAGSPFRQVVHVIGLFSGAAIAALILRGLMAALRNVRERYPKEART